ncbi:MAG: hypothetical protein GTO30_13495, partial [Acidobacteria bacterium]|nr:hypothetical protein [Acidobacteriota bacterium]NIQ87142.1 hypothetical protein [Acidobacteriota bacterium]
MIAAESLRDIYDSPAGVLAYYGSRGQLVPVAVTPYVLGDEIYITATLAYAEKAVLVRRSPKVALLAGRVNLRADAEVYADVKGEFFVKHLLEQEMRKYPPARTLRRIPFHRRLFGWFFGRAIIKLQPVDVESDAGDDAWTLVTEGADGYPSIHSIPDADPLSGDVAVPAGPGRYDGPAVVFWHSESDDMSKLQSKTFRGEIKDGSFVR